MDKVLSGKTALITGASRGIGKSISEKLAEMGADLVITSRKQPVLEEVAHAITSYGGSVLPLACHMGEPAQIETLFAKIEKEKGGVDILVNNAATNPIFGPILMADENAWNKIMDVNVKGYFLSCKAVHPYMAQKGYGKIVNVASTAGLNPSFGLGAYSVSKAAVIMLTKVLAKEWGTFGIRVNALCPGLVKTKFSQALWSVQEILDEALKMQPIPGLAEPMDVVGAAVFMCIPASDFMTGHALVVDGGGIL